MNEKRICGIRGIKYENSSNVIKDIKIDEKLEIIFEDDDWKSIGIYHNNKRIGYIPKEMAKIIRERKEKFGSEYECLFSKHQTFIDEGINYNGGFVSVQQIK